MEVMKHRKTCDQKPNIFWLPQQRKHEDGVVGENLTAKNHNNNNTP